MSACETCAFGNAGAAKEVKNRLVSIICAYSARPFFCHHGKSGTEYDWKGGDKLAFMALPPTDRKLCDGWKAEVRKLKAAGHFNIGETPEDQAALRRYGRMLGADALHCLESYLTEKDPRDKEDLRKELKDLIRALAPERKTA